VSHNQPLKAEKATTKPGSRASLEGKVGNDGVYSEWGQIFRKGLLEMLARGNIHARRTCDGEHCLVAGEVKLWQAFSMSRKRCSGKAPCCCLARKLRRRDAKACGRAQVQGTFQWRTITQMAKGLERIEAEKRGHGFHTNIFSFAKEKKRKIALGNF